MVLGRQFIKSAVSRLVMYFLPISFLQVGILDLDICGPSVPKMLNVDNITVVNTGYGSTPLELLDNNIVLSIFAYYALA